MLDRTAAPLSTPITDLSIPEAEPIALPNGLEAFFIHDGDQDAIKIEFIMDSGVYFENKSGVSYMTSKMILEGTSRIKSKEIYSRLDYYGAFVETSSGLDYISISVYTLSRYLEPVLNLILEILQHSVFPKEEFDSVRNLKIQKLKVNLAKDSIVATRKFRQHLYGSDHPYGRILSESHLHHLNRDEAFSFYRESFLNNVRIIASGKVDKQTKGVLRNILGSINGTSQSTSNIPIQPLGRQKIIEKENSVQSSVRIGRPIIDRSHVDIHPLHVTCSLLGGYFGSRLMQNIREDKGYTYGIYASLAHLMQASFLVISTEVKKEFTSNTIKEIKLEIDRLKEEKVDKEELETLKNYLLGQFLSSLDSPLNIAQKFKNVYLAGLNYRYYEDYLSTLKNITPDQIQEIAQKYLVIEDFTTVVVGGLPDSY